MINQKDLVIISQKTNGHCFYCGSKYAFEVDHFCSKYWHKVWQLDGYCDVDDLCNLFLSCISCNRRKSNKHPETFIGNTYKAWSMYIRANQRVGLMDKKITMNEMV